MIPAFKNELVPLFIKLFNDIYIKNFKYNYIKKPAISAGFFLLAGFL